MYLQQNSGFSVIKNTNNFTLYQTLNATIWPCS